MYLVFDTETSGLPLWNRPAEDIRQPSLMQLACLLLDESFKEIACFYTLIKPSREYIVHSKAYEAHGLTKERCEQYGIYVSVALDIFTNLCAKSSLQIAHHIKFDSMLMAIEYAVDRNESSLIVSPYCTMLSSTDICKLPGRNGNYKWPKLQEVYSYMFGQPFDKAHDALADVRATAKVFKALQQWSVPS